MTNPFAKNPLTDEAPAEAPTEEAKTLPTSDTPHPDETKKAKAVAKQAKQATQAKDTKVSEASGDDTAPNREADAPAVSEAKAEKLTPAKERDLLRAKVAELEAQLAGASAEEPAVTIVEDEIVSEDEPGGKIRLVAGQVLINNDWKVHVDGLRVLIGRAESQATANFQVPKMYVDSLTAVLGHIGRLTR